MSAELLGTFSDDSGPAPLTELSLAFPALDFIVQWKRAGLTADFVADYFSYHFPDPPRARSSLSTVINELLENAAKFSSDKAETLRLQVRNYGDRVVVLTHNATDARRADRLRGWLGRLASEDVDRLFQESLERQDSGPGVGLIILRRDYGATIGARLSARAGSTLVDVEVQVAIGEEQL